MPVMPEELGAAPPLRTLWKSARSLVSALLGSNTIYGITLEGYVAALDAATGDARWATTTTYVPTRLAADGATLYGFQVGVGLVAVHDQGTSAEEQNLFKLTTVDSSTAISQPVPMEKVVHFVLENRLLAVDAITGAIQFSLDLGAEGPYTLQSMGSDLLTVSGAGRPTRIRVNTDSYTVLWSAGPGGADDLSERAVLVTEQYVFTAVPNGVAAYNASSGRLAWTLPGVGNTAFAYAGNTLYCAGTQAGIWAVNVAGGGVLWDRQYLAFVSRTSRVGLAVNNKCLWVGALLDDGQEPAALWAMSLENGAFLWQATGAYLTYGNGLPLVAAERMFTYGSRDPVTAMTGLGGVPAVTPGDVWLVPNPLRGPMSNYNPVELHLRLAVPAKIWFTPWHERDIRSSVIGPISYGATLPTIYYDARWPRGWTDINQFGRMAVDIEETDSGLKYTVVIPVSVNTLSDIQHHWAKASVEAMIYHQYIGGYPDMTFRPNNLITRAESSTIIAKTLSLARPTAGFRTKFTDIASHWARDFIMALEEKGIIGGFEEANGTFTFRPDAQMTRAQDAKILVVAYGVTAAPASFSSKFTDTAGHWAEPFIRALEYGGFASGFREADGTYTFRPEQNLTRAELCTLVVRIRHLTR